MGKCPYCEENIPINDVQIEAKTMGREAPKPLSQFAGKQINLGMISCPHCEKIRSFIYG